MCVCVHLWCLYVYVRVCICSVYVSVCLCVCVFAVRGLLFGVISLHAAMFRGRRKRGGGIDFSAARPYAENFEEDNVPSGSHIDFRYAFPGGRDAHAGTVGRYEEVGCGARETAGTRSSIAGVSGLDRAPMRGKWAHFENSRPGTDRNSSWGEGE